MIKTLQLKHNIKQKTFPFVFINDKFIGGTTETLNLFKNSIRVAISYFNKDAHEATSSLLDTLENKNVMYNDDLDFEKIRKSVLDMNISDLGSMLHYKFQISNVNQNSKKKNDLNIGTM